MNSNTHLRIENPHRNLKFWHKVQVHCHSSESDAKRGQTPMAIEEAYRDAGYTCVFLTDHNRVTPDPKVPGILHIDGAEYGLGRHHTLALGVERHGNDNGIESITSCACSNISKRLAHVARVDNAIAVAAHPNARHFCSRLICPRFCGGGWSPRELSSHAQHYAGLEIFNANNAARRMWSLNRWDEVLATGARMVWGFASDDCHYVRDEKTFDRGFVLVNSAIDPDDFRRGLAGPDTLRRDVLENIRIGNFWAVVRSQGVRGEAVSGEGSLWLTFTQSERQIRVAVPRRCDTIEFCAASSSRRESSSTLGSAEFAYDVGNWEEYVRVRVVLKTEDGRSLTVLSQPLSIRRE